MGRAVHVIGVETDDPRWLTLIEARGGNIFHSPPWLGSLADAYGFHTRAYLIIDRAGQPVAGLPFCRIADLLGERIVSLPFSDFCDPLISSADQWDALLRAVEALDLPATFRCLDDRAAATDGRLRIVKRKHWHAVRLEPELNALWARLAAPTRRAIRKAEREGVIVRTLDDETLLTEFIRIQVALRKRKYRLLAQPRAFFDALRQRFTPIGGWLPLAACHGGRVVAVTIYLRWKNTLYYKFNASLDAALPLRPNDALLWAGIRLAKSLGCRVLDLGVSDINQPGLIRFKRQYGAEERHIRFLRSARPGCPDGQEARTMALLGRLTELFTDPAIPDEVSGSAGAALYRFFA